MSSAVGDVICSGYNSQLKQFMFISNSNNLSSIDNYRLNLYNNSSDYRNISFSAFSNAPDQSIYEYGGLCYFNPTSLTFYLNFQTKNESITSIYQLQPYASTPKFQSLNITIVNETLSSLAIVNDLSQPYLAYVSQNQLNHKTALHLQSLYDPSRNGFKTTYRSGVLSVGGSHLQNLYYVEDEKIEIYNMDTRRYASSQLHTHISSAPVQIFMDYAHPAENSNIEYVYSYSPATAVVDIIRYDASASNFSQFFDFSTLNVTNSGTSSPVPPNSTTGATTATTATTTALSTTFTRINSTHEKRDVKPVYSDEIEYSSDRSFNHYQAQIRNEDVPRGILLVPAANMNQDPPYDYTLINYQGDSNLFSAHTVSGETGTDKIGLSPGAIVGIVIGILAFIGIIGSIFFVTMKKKRQSKHIELKKERSREIDSGFVQPMESIVPSTLLFVSPYMDKGVQENEIDSPSQTSSILQESKDIPEEYYDGHRPDIRPLSYSGDHIDYAQLPPEELLQLEPDVHTSLSLFSGAFTSPADERVAYIEEGHTTRTFYSQNSHHKYTVHYFSSRHLATFVRCVHASIRMSSSYVIQSERAIVLNEPTPIFQYQYIWITSPMILEQSLHHVLLNSNWNKTDTKLIDYQTWSIYNMLKSLETYHTQNFVHLAIDLKAFYFESVQKSTEWKLGNLDYSYSIKESGIRNIVLPTENTVFTAPELLNPQKRDEIVFYHQQNILEAIDIWSLGCAIYTVASNGLFLFEDEQQIQNLARFQDDMSRHLKNAVRNNIEDLVVRDLLHMTLQVDPNERKSIKQVLVYWNTIYYMGPDSISNRDTLIKV